MHNRRVSQRRRESFDATSDSSPARSKGINEIEVKLARAERNREALRCERRRRTMQRYEEGRARALQQGLLGFGAGVGGGGAGLARGAEALRGGLSFGVEAGTEHRRRRATEARQAAKARQAQRMRLLRQRMLTRNSRVGERKTRLYAARLLQAWWRCVRDGRPFHVTALTITSAEPAPDRSLLGSPTSWAAAAATHDSGLTLSTDFEPSSNTSNAGKTGNNREASSPLDPCTKSPVSTFRKFHAGVGGARMVGVAGTISGPAIGGGGVAAVASDAASPTTEYDFRSTYEAAVRIQSFLRRNMHTLKVANGLLAGRLSIKVLCAAVRTMASSTFDEAIEIMSTRAIVSHCETTLKALRMGREMRTVPQTVRSARAFLSSLLVNFFPTSALDDEGALSSSPEGTAALQVEKDRLVRAAGNVINALLLLEITVDAGVEAAVVGNTTKEAGDPAGDAPASVGAMDTSQFRSMRRAAGMMVRSRVAFCQRFAEWKRKDAIRLADEMTASSVDVLLMQLRAERDLRVAALRYGLEDTDDDGSLFSTGYDQIKDGTQRQLGKMMHALSKLVGPEGARERMDQATDAAFERLRADELAEDELFMREHGGDFGDERAMRMDTDEESDHLSSRRYGSSSLEGGAGAKFGGSRTGSGAGTGSAYASGMSATATASEIAAVMAEKAAAEEDDIAGPRRPLSAGDLLSNEWLVHEVERFIMPCVCM